MGKLTKKELQTILNGNKYVKTIADNGNVFYTDAFYKELKVKLEAGIDRVIAYESMGFNTKVLGKDRAYKACKRALELKLDDSFKYVDGTKHSSLMKNLSPEEELAYLRSRVYVLEQLEELKKKDSSLYQWAIQYLLKD